MFSSGGDVVVIFAREAQLGAVTLVHDVPQLFGGQRLPKQAQNSYFLIYGPSNSHVAACFTQQLFDLLNSKCRKLLQAVICVAAKIY